jgi:tetratricopeptide (TPR) repeat protein
MRFKGDYEKEYTEKLIYIRDTRARRAAAMQGGMVPQPGLAAGMAGVGQNQVQGAFPQQMNRPIQASSIPGQPQVELGGAFDLDEAARVYNGRLEECRRTFGDSHAHTTSLMINLASVLKHQNRLSDAELQQLPLPAKTDPTCVRELSEAIDEAAKVFNGELEKSRRTLGDHHPYIASLMSNLASVLKRQGRLSEAEELQQQALEARDRVLGPEHLDTLASLDDLMSTYMDQHRWKEAEELGVRAFHAYRMVLGVYHPRAGTSIAKLATTYKNQDRWKEAEELERQLAEDIANAT